MRLHLDTGSQLQGAAEAGAVAGARGSAASGARNLGGVTDSVGLSGPSAALNRFAQDRAARIQKLAAAVQNGSYQVTGAAVSRAMVEHSIV